MWGVYLEEQRSGHYGWLLAGYVPDKGDIVLLDFDPSAGKEIIKRRLALVISRQSFNDHTGFSMVAPITRTVRRMALEVPLQGNQPVTQKL